MGSCGKNSDFKWYWCAFVCILSSKFGISFMVSSYKDKKSSPIEKRQRKEKKQWLDSSIHFTITRLQEVVSFHSSFPPGKYENLILSRCQRDALHCKKFQRFREKSSIKFKWKHVEKGTGRYNARLPQFTVHANAFRTWFM